MENSADLTKLLEATFETYAETGDSTAEHDRLKQDFVFHMTDWLKDLQSLSQLYQSPESRNREEAVQAIFKFLVHAAPHLREAGRLLFGEERPNPFASETSDRPANPTPANS
jgi:hypothetical protein